MAHWGFKHLTLNRTSFYLSLIHNLIIHNNLLIFSLRSRFVTTPKRQNSRSQLIFGTRTCTGENQNNAMFSALQLPFWNLNLPIRYGKKQQFKNISQNSWSQIFLKFRGGHLQWTSVIAKLQVSSLLIVLLLMVFTVGLILVKSSRTINRPK